MAGKIAKGDWRHEIVPGLRDSRGLDDLEEKRAWPALKFVLGDRTLEYVGPFFVSCDHGCAHGRGDHGNSVTRNNICGSEPWGSKHDAGSVARGEVFSRCLDSILDCDLFFAWLDQRDAYGTLVEIGIAHGLNRGIGIFVASPEGFDSDDFWFAGETGYDPGILHFKNPREALLFAIAKEAKRRDLSAGPPF